MFRGIESVMIGSENPRRLAEFYRDKLGLKLTQEFEMGDDGAEGFVLELDDGPVFYVNMHSEVHGENENPERIIINLEVADCEEACKKLKSNGITIVKDMYHVEGYGLIATFEDPDGNYLQCVQVRAHNDAADEDDDEEEEAETNGKSHDLEEDEDEN